jgi:hypothetical protein
MSNILRDSNGFYFINIYTTSISSTGIWQIVLKKLFRKGVFENAK